MGTVRQIKKLIVIGSEKEKIWYGFQNYITGGRRVEIIIESKNMTYEEENIELKKRLIEIDKEIDEIHSFIREADSLRYNLTGYSRIDFTVYNANQRLMILNSTKSNINEVLKESPIQRKVSNTAVKVLDKLPHMEVVDSEKTTYGVSNSDGCFWTFITIIIIVGLIFHFFL